MSGSSPRPPLQPEVPDVTTVMEWLFIETMADLNRRVMDTPEPPADRFAVLGIARIVRSLLMDSSPLADVVNRRHGIKLRYSIRPWQQPSRDLREDVSEGEHALLVANVYPRTDDETLVDVTRDRLLGTVVARTGDDEDVTVRDVVKFYSNVEGAVHAGRPATLKEARLMQTTGALVWRGEPVESSPIFVLKQIGHIVGAGLEPLDAAVLANPLAPTQGAIVKMFTI